jgi:hypothetical protein
VVVVVVVLLLLLLLPPPPPPLLLRARKVTPHSRHAAVALENKSLLSAVSLPLLRLVTLSGG